MQRTLEQRLKFDSALPLGRHIVDLTLGHRLIRALVDISPRGRVTWLREPEQGDLYTSWQHQTGDTSSACKKSGLLVRPFEISELMASFTGPARAAVVVRETT